MRRVLPLAGQGRLTGAVVLLLLPLLVRLARAWSAAPEQAYGWAVPALALWLGLERARRAPPARPSGAGAAWALVLGLAAYAAALPVLEANPLWPTAQWAAAAAAATAVLGGLALAGGAAWAGHFAFPVLFLFTALLWPSPARSWIATSLTAGNARIAAEFVSALGHPAVVDGSVITVARGYVGLDEACSGLRSLQAVLMSGCFLGELFRLGARRRMGLVAAAVGLALGFNLARTIFLTWETAARGPAAGERWHDPAGSAELVLTLAAVFLLALRRGRAEAAGLAAAVAGSAAPAASAAPLRLGWCLPALAACLLAEAGTQAWYAWHERRMPQARLHWDLTPPVADWHSVEVPPRIRETLGSSAAGGLAWTDPATQREGLAFLVSWGGDPAAAENLRWHDPTLCLPAAGGRLERELGAVPLALGGRPVPFAGYRFSFGGEPLYVFFCHWDSAGGKSEPAPDPAARLGRVRRGVRRVDAASLALEVRAASDEEARAWAAEWAPRVFSSRS